MSSLLRARVVSSAWLLLAGCADLTTPSPGAGPAQAASAPATASAARARPRPSSAAPQDAPLVTASHVLIAYRGALRSRSQRSKDEARTIAAQVRARAAAGEEFGALAARFSDDPSGKAAGGSLGSFPRNSMVRPLSNAAALRPGQISDVVESEFGFHVIKRTE